MYSSVPNGRPFCASMASLVAKCHLFQTKPELLGKSHKVESSVSSNSLRMFAGAIGGAVAEIKDANVQELS
jgi:hypothetical protein